MNILRFSILFLFVATISSAQMIPTEKAKALDDSEVVLPDPGSQRVLILVLGFSHKSADLIEDWGKHIAAEFHGDARVAYYQIPDLQGVPGLVKPMILHGMHKDIPPAEQPHFVPIYDHITEWKKIVNFSAPNDAYIMVATPEGHPIWQFHGTYSEATYEELKNSVATLLERTQNSPQP